MAILMILGTLVSYWKLGEAARDGYGSIEYEQFLVIMPNAVLVLCYFGLWLWSKKQPFAAAMVALVLFVTLQVVNLMVEPSTWFDGIILKTLIIVALFGAVQAGLKAQRIRAEYARDKRAWVKS